MTGPDGRTERKPHNAQSQIHPPGAPGGGGIGAPNLGSGGGIGPAALGGGIGGLGGMPGGGAPGGLGGAPGSGIGGPAGLGTAGTGLGIVSVLTTSFALYITPTSIFITRDGLVKQNGNWGKQSN